MQGNILGQSGINAVPNVFGMKVYQQLNEPSAKKGIWLKTSEKADKVYCCNKIFDSYEKIKDLPYLDGYLRGKTAVVGKDIYLFGGKQYTSSGYNFAYKYDTTRNKYTNKKRMPDDFINGAAVAVGTDVYLFFFEEMYKYDTINDTYEQLQNQPYGAYHKQVATIGNSIYLMGGYASVDYFKYNYKYDILTDTYTKLADIPYNIDGVKKVVAVGDDIYIFGFSENRDYSGEEDEKYAYKYNVITDTYTKLTNIPFKFKNGSVVAVGTNIHIVSQLNHYIYDTITGLYTKLKDIPQNVTSPRAEYVENYIYIFSSSEDKYACKYLIFENSCIFITLNIPDSITLVDELYKTITNVDIYDSNGIQIDTEVYIGDGTKWNLLN